MILTIISSLLFVPAHAVKPIAPSRGAACAALLGANPAAFEDALAAALSTRQAHAAFQSLRRSKMNAPDDVPISDDLVVPNAFTTNAAGEKERLQAARRLRTLERVVEGKSSVDFQGPVDFATQNVRVGFVIPGQTAIDVYLQRVEARLETASTAERARASQRKVTPDLAESTLIKTLFPKSGLLRSALLFGGPVAIDHLFAWFHHAKEFSQWLDVMTEVAASGDVDRWAHATLATDASSRYMTEATKGEADRAAETHFADAYRGLFGPGEPPALKDLVIDFAVANDLKDGVVSPSLAVMVRYQAPRPNDRAKDAAGTSRWQAARAHLDSFLK